MPSYHDAPVVSSSSSSSLVSRHDAGARSLEGGAAEQLSDESDEPPNKQIHANVNGEHFSDESESDTDAGHDADVEDFPTSVRGRAMNATKSTPRHHVESVESTDASSSSDGDEASSDDGSVGSSPLYLPSLNPMQASTGYSLPDGYDPSGACDELPPAGVSVSYVNPKLEARTSKTGSGVFAIEPIKAGEVLIVWTGRILSAEQTLSIMDTPDKHYILQIGDGFYQTPLQSNREPADWTNHSCNPNAGFGKQSPICLSAMKEIEVGDEVTFDYGMCETDERLWEPMECLCGSPFCRALITANDWKLHPQLWQRYEGFFAPHVQRKIDQLKQELNEQKLPQSAEADKANNSSTAAVDGAMIVAPVFTSSSFGWFDSILWKVGIVRAANLPSAILA